MQNFKNVSTKRHSSIDFSNVEVRLSKKCGQFKYRLGELRDENVRDFKRSPF
jgi:hypothetical protein